MPNPDHLAWLREGVEAWNERRAHFTNADLSLANLAGAHLAGAQLAGADLSGADLDGAYLRGAYLDGANLVAANLRNAHLDGADLCGAHLDGAYLNGAYLGNADLRGAHLGGADLQRTTFVGTRLQGADLTGCRVYGISAWDLHVDEHTTQVNLIITPAGQAEVSVDNLKVAQFVYLLLNNPEIRDVIDTVAKKAVLILGNFGAERKAVLDALRDELRKRDYVPILFDFEKPDSRDLAETVSTLAHLARFVIADLTEPKSVPQELSHIVPILYSVPVQPIILAGQRPYALFEHFVRSPLVLKPYPYANQKALLAGLEERVIAPAEAKAQELAPPKREAG